MRSKHLQIVTNEFTIYLGTSNFIEFSQFMLMVLDLVNGLFRSSLSCTIWECGALGSVQVLFIFGFGLDSGFVFILVQFKYEL